jgi:hypothetical protein
MRLGFLVAGCVGIALVTGFVAVSLVIGGWHRWQSDRQAHDLKREAEVIKEQTATIQLAARNVQLPADFIEATTFRTVTCKSTNFVIGCWTSTLDEAAVAGEVQRAMTAAGLPNQTAACSSQYGSCHVSSSTSAGQLDFVISAPPTDQQATTSADGQTPGRPVCEIRALAVPRNI